MKALQHFFVNEWYFAIPMVLMMIVAFALVVLRLILNMHATTRLDQFLPLLTDTLKQKGVPGAVSLCKQERGLIPSVMYVAGLEASDKGVAAMRRSMATAVELEVLPRLNAWLAPILAIAKIATMVGLLGTVISMINTFNAIGEASGQGSATNVAAQSGAIGLALFATAMGLITAIPLVFAHVLFKDWIHRFETKMKGAAAKLVILVQNAREG